MDESDMPEVIGHLIDEMRLAGPIGTGIGEISLPKAPELLLLEARENRRVARIAIFAVAAHQFRDETRYVRQFERALDSGVRGKDLFEQRRSGAGETYDEDRCIARAPDPGALSEEVPRANLHQQPRIALDCLRTISAHGFF